MSRFALFIDMEDESEHIVDLENHCELDLGEVVGFLNDFQIHKKELLDLIHEFEELGM